MSGPKIFVKACINGARTPDQHPNLPISPDQLATAAVAAHQAGALAVHMHPKTADGVDSLRPDTVDAAVAAVRRALPGLPLGVTTGYWALPDAAERLAAVQAWSVLPDFASLNWHEPGSPELAELLLSRGLGVEVGIFHAEAAESWGQSDIARHCMRVMIELGPDADTGTADDLLDRVRSANYRHPCCCTGSTTAAGRCWSMPVGSGCRPGSGWRTRCDCPTGRQRRAMPNWWPRRFGCCLRPIASLLRPRSCLARLRRLG